MMTSVSTFSRASGAATPVRTVKVSMVRPPSAELPQIGDAAGDCAGCSKRRAGEMGAGARTLAADEVAVRGRHDALARRHHLAIGGSALRAARFAPFEAGVA